MTINGKAYIGEQGQTILDAAKGAGVFIPSLCFDARVEAAGACGVCVVEVSDEKGSAPPRLSRACATIIASGMAVWTDSERVVSAQKRVLELLLSAHSGDCVAPCRTACPAETDCGQFIALAAAGKYEEAHQLMMEAHPFPASVARVCPRPCEKACRRALRDEAVNIAGLKRYIVDKPSNISAARFSVQGESPKIAIIGGGPAGLTAAYFLQRSGHQVTVYDRAPKMGGLLRYGIPEYRLPKKVLDAEIAAIESMGVTFVNGLPAPPLETLRAENKAVIIATGASRSKSLGCAGDDLPGVLGGTDFLRRAAMGERPYDRLRKVVVVGGSNTAIDAARTALRLGAEEVIIAYRRTRSEMPAAPAEIAEAEAEGVVFKFLVAPLEVVENAERAAGIRLQTMALGEPDASGRRAPVPVGKEEWLEADLLISAIGQEADAHGFEALRTHAWGGIEADPHTFATNLPGVYAIGDVTGQSAYAIEAIAHARKAAMAVYEYVHNIRICGTLLETLLHIAPAPDDFAHVPPAPRMEALPLPPAQTKHSWEEVHPTLTPAQAAQEAERCLRCGCAGYHKCKLIALVNQLQADPEKYSRLKASAPASSPSHGSITHNPDKCILCTLCVRACDKHYGLLSVSHRSYATAIYTEYLNAPACADCGTCAAICPTGAMSSSCALMCHILTEKGV